MENMIFDVNESVSGSIQSMPKVYFCCHPDDFEEYYEKTKKELHRIFPNISFWYYDANQEPDGDDVNQMNLMVIIVTNRFLDEYENEKYACYKALKLAKEKCIPQLPLLQEGVPEEGYAMVFGHSQYLSKTDHGAFAISYEEKLKKRLNETLLNEEEIKRIENAFLATIFLSYRKKDRKFIHKIMELIHSNEKYQEVSIWYDEFLTPGEEFDKEIGAVLEKSDLFTLMVTANLLEEGNYVMREEYPQAVQCNLPILPIKCAQTDEEAFRGVFQGVSDIYSLEDEAQISEELHKILQDKIENKKTEDPKQKYLIGMAYLHGVNVEKNSDRAIELLSNAAESGCDEAYERLTSIYHNGDGIIESAPELEIVWQRKYVEKLKAQLSDENSKMKLLLETKKLAECIYGRVRFDEAKEVYKEALSLLNELKGSGYKDIEDCEYQLYSEIGDSIRLKASDLKKTLSEDEVQEAKEYYLAALNMSGEDISKQVVQYTNLAGLLYQLAEFIILGKQDNQDRARELLKEAREYCQKALDIQQELMQKSQSYDTLKSQSVLSDRMAGIYLLLEKYEKALEYFDVSLKIWEKFKEEYPSKYHEEGYFLARYNCAETLYHLGIENDAEKELVWVAKLIGRLKDKTGGLTYVGILTGYKASYLLSTIYKSNRDQKKYNYYANAMKKYESVVKRFGR